MGRGTGFLKCEDDFTLDFLALICRWDIHIELSNGQSHFWAWGLFASQTQEGNME